MVAAIYLNKPVGLKKKKKGWGSWFYFVTSALVPAPQSETCCCGQGCVCLSPWWGRRKAVHARVWEGGEPTEHGRIATKMSSYVHFEGTTGDCWNRRQSPFKSRPGQRHSRLSCRVANLLNRDWSGTLVCTAIPFRADRFGLLTMASPLLEQHSVTVSPRHWKLLSGSSRIRSCNHQSNISSSEASLSSCPEVRLCLQVITSPGHVEAEGLEAGTH